MRYRGLPRAVEEEPVDLTAPDIADDMIGEFVQFSSGKAGKVRSTSSSVSLCIDAADEALAFVARGAWAASGSRLAFATKCDGLAFSGAVFLLKMPRGVKKKAFRLADLPLKQFGAGLHTRLDEPKDALPCLRNVIRSANLSLGMRHQSALRMRT